MNSKSLSQWLRLTAVFFLLLAALAPASLAYADSCVVTTPADGGAGSLREKIADPVCDTITFDGDYTMVLASQLTIARNVTIDGVGHDVTVSGNHAVRAFDVLPDVTFNLSNLAVADGYAGIGYPGGGIYNRGMLNVTNTVFSGNGAQDGGGIYIDLGTASVTDSTFTNNFAYWEGGGIYVHSAVVTVAGSSFNSNSAECGPAIHNAGTLSVTNTDMTGGRAQYCGGGIYNSGALELTNSTISGNLVDFGTGGGIFNNGGAVTSTNITMTDNQAPFAGGAIMNNGGTVMFTNSTLSGNRAGEGGGILNEDGGTATFMNTLIANNLSNYNCMNVESTLSGSNNLADDESCGPAFANSPSILLGPLADNGGPTQTMALLPGSAAIDAGDDTACPATDQRGEARPQGAHCDIGAYEAEATADDTTPPGITLTTPPENVVYLLGQTVYADYACQDEAGGSGLASCVGDVPNGSPIDTGSVGGKTFTVDAADQAGNTASVTHTYQVIYSFAGFTSPVDNPSIMNNAKAGQTIPLKWRLTDASGSPVTSLTGVSVRAVNLACPSSPTTDAIEEYVTSNSGLQNLGDGYYQWNWRSPISYANTCKTLKLDLGEGAGFEHLALFQFRK